MEPSCENFLALPFDEQKTILCAALRACAEMWGNECMPAADIGDNRVFDMDDLVAWIADR